MGGFSGRGAYLQLYVERNHDKMDTLARGLHREPCGAETVKAVQGRQKLCEAQRRVGGGKGHLRADCGLGTVGACAGSQWEAQADVQGKKGAEYLFRHCLLPGLRQAHFILS